MMGSLMKGVKVPVLILTSLTLSVLRSLPVLSSVPTSIILSYLPSIIGQVPSSSIISSYFNHPFLPPFHYRFSGPFEFHHQFLLPSSFLTSLPLSVLRSLRVPSSVPTSIILSYLPSVIGSQVPSSSIISSYFHHPFLPPFHYRFPGPFQFHHLVLLPFRHHREQVWPSGKALGW